MCLFFCVHYYQVRIFLLLCHFCVLGGTAWGNTLKATVKNLVEKRKRMCIFMYNPEVEISNCSRKRLTERVSKCQLLSGWIFSIPKRKLLKFHHPFLNHCKLQPLAFGSPNLYCNYSWLSCML